MPVRPEMRERYPADWKAISHRIRFERAGGCCEHCGVAHGAEIPRKSKRPSKAGRQVTIVVLTTAHLYDPDPAAVEDSNLAALCQACHLAWDRPMHLKNAAETKRRKAEAAEAEARRLRRGPIGSNIKLRSYVATP